MVRIGVFLCHCGTNIGGVVKMDQLAEYCRDFSYVSTVIDYKYLCSQPGQSIIKDAIKKYDLNRIIVGSCSPRMHEKTFRNAIKDGGLNPYLLHIVNLREHCSWVHKDRDKATDKAKSLMRAGIERAVFNKPLSTVKIPVTKKALVIGGGIAGIQAALDIADAGIEVVLVEREPSIGGRMSQLDKTFPTLDCSACILSPKMVDAGFHPNITLKTYAEVTNVSGSVGNFKVTINNKARYVHSSCTGCGDCFKVCPGKCVNSYNESLDKRKAIYIQFPQAVPATAVIDSSACLYFKTGKCKVCQKKCNINAIDFDMTDQTEEVDVGAIVVATGYDVFDYKAYGEYGTGSSNNIISSLQLERLFSSSGPTDAKVKIPGTDKTPKNIVFIQCVGSRDEKKGKTYCSKICCMYTAKHTLLLKEKIPDVQITVFYLDLRTPGKGYEEFLTRAQSQEGINYIRGRVSKLSRRPDGSVRVSGVDTLLGDIVSVDADLVVLATAVVSKNDAKDLSRILGISTDKDSFFSEAHPKLKPVETQTAGIFLAGICQGPKDIPETVASASATAAKVLGILSKDHIESLAMTTTVNETKCSGCFFCLQVCPYKAIEKKELENGEMVSTIKEELCQGCGACVAACRGGALDLKGFDNNMLLTETMSLCQD